MVGVKVMSCAYGVYSRRNHLPGWLISVVYLVWNLLFLAVTHGYHPASAVWYLMCAASDFGLASLLFITFESRKLRDALILFLMLCVAVNFCTYLEDPTPYTFFYRNWSFLIQVLGLCECFVICVAPSYNASDLGVVNRGKQESADQRRREKVIRPM